MTDCSVERISVLGGRAAGVVARVRGEDGSETELDVEAPVVVVACGGIESPALLLRSAIGGPAAGKHLCLHPTYFVTGLYEEEVNAWNGQFQATVSFDFAHAVEGAGFLVESVGLSLPFWAASLPFTGGAAHKERMLLLRFAATWHAVSHDTGTGEVVLGPGGEPVVRWELDHPVDRAVAARAHVELAAPPPRPRGAGDPDLPLGRVSAGMTAKTSTRSSFGSSRRRTTARLFGASDELVPARHRPAGLRRRGVR